MDNRIGVSNTQLNQSQVDILYDLLKRFEIIAQKSGLRYSIACGTALGAVLRGGLIPWDNDADIFALHDDFTTKLPIIVRNAAGHFTIEKYTRWSDGRGWYKIYHPRAPYPNIDLYLLEPYAKENVWRPSDAEIRRRAQMYLTNDQIAFHERIGFGPLSLPIFSNPVAFFDRYYGPKWRFANSAAQADGKERILTTRDAFLDFRPSLPSVF